MFHNSSIGKCHPNIDNPYKGFFFPVVKQRWIALKTVSCLQATLTDHQDRFIQLLQAFIVRECHYEF
jgi:hypothetical protein